MSKICIIPARGGSKRIPRKNIRPFLDRPIISYSIELAISTNLFDEIIVSTDDKEIAEIAKGFGAKVPFFRSAKASNDFATTKDVLDEVLNEYSLSGIQFKELLCLYPTSIFSKKEDLIKANIKLKDFNTVLAVTKFSYPPQRGFKLNSKNNLEYLFPEFISSRSQDLSPWFHDAGQWCWYNLINGKVDNDKSEIGFVELSNLAVQDIDTLEDWRIAEIKYKINKI